MDPVRQRRLLILFIMIVYLIVPLFASQLYFRNDDSVLLLWSKNFDQPIYQAFSTDRDINTTAQYGTFGVYWRPFTNLYIKILWDLFGANPMPYFIFAGILFNLSIYFLFKIVEKRAGIFSAGISSLIFIMLFQNAFYHIFRIDVPIRLFFQLALLLNFYLYLNQGKKIHLLFTFLLLVPAMARMTSAVILTTFLIIVTVEQKNKIPVVSKRNIFALGFVLISLYLIKFSSIESVSGIFSLFPDIGALYAFFHERFIYYGSILTHGITGFFILILISGRFFQSILNKLKGPLFFRNHFFPFFLLFLGIGFIFQKLSYFAPFWLFFCLLTLLILDKQLRLFIAWAAVSLAFHMTAVYYHAGYILEAAYPFAAVIGIIIKEWYSLSSEKLKNIRPDYLRLYRLAAGLLIIILTITAYQKKNIIINNIHSIKTFIDNNKIYSDIMHYIEHDHPQNTIIVRFTEEETGMLSRRALSINERAEKMANMNIEDMRFMIQVLNRHDLRIIPTDAIDRYQLPNTTFFLCLNNYERRMAEDIYPLFLVKEFKKNEESGALYQLNR